MIHRSIVCGASAGHQGRTDDNVTKGCSDHNGVDGADHAAPCVPFWWCPTIERRLAGASAAMCFTCPTSTQDLYLPKHLPHAGPRGRWNRGAMSSVDLHRDPVDARRQASPVEVMTPGRFLPVELNVTAAVVVL